MPLTYSPLRYPGGKTKLSNIVGGLMEKNSPKGIYVEPFAGGAGLAFKFLFSHLAEDIVLNDIDYHVYCFWKACVDYCDGLCELIDSTVVDIKSWKIQKEIFETPERGKILETGFATFFLNRCNVSGIIKGGPIGGIDQSGPYKIDARFNKEDLKKKIRWIGSQKDHICLYNLDASKFLRNELRAFPYDKTFIYIDPPYIKKGPLLYENSFTEQDHISLSLTIKDIRYKWILTYDDHPLVYQMYSGYSQEPIVLNYSTGNSKKGNEILVLGHDVRQ